MQDVGGAGSEKEIDTVLSDSKGKSKKDEVVVVEVETGNSTIDLTEDGKHLKGQILVIQFIS